MQKTLDNEQKQKQRNAALGAKQEKEQLPQGAVSGQQGNLKPSKKSKEDNKSDLRPLPEPIYRRHCKASCDVGGLSEAEEVNTMRAWRLLGATPLAAGDGHQRSSLTVSHRIIDQYSGHSAITRLQ